MERPPRKPIVSARQLQLDQADIDLVVPIDLFWFRGHFEAFPVLPGVVQIDWAMDLARECLGLNLPAAQDFQVKFVAPIRPGDSLRLTLRLLREGTRLSFEYRRDGQLCSNGQVMVRA